MFGRFMASLLIFLNCECCNGEAVSKTFLAKVNNFKFTYIYVTSDPDSFLCLPVIYRCYLKALTCPLSQTKRILLMQSRQMCRYLNLFSMCFCHLLCLYDGMKGRSSASDIVKGLSQQILLAL